MEVMTVAGHAVLLKLERPALTRAEVVDDWQCPAEEWPARRAEIRDHQAPFDRLLAAIRDVRLLRGKR